MAEDAGARRSRRTGGWLAEAMAGKAKSMHDRIKTALTLKRWGWRN